MSTLKRSMNGLGVFFQQVDMVALHLFTPSHRHRLGDRLNDFASEVEVLSVAPDNFLEAHGRFVSLALDIVLDDNELLDIIFFIPYFQDVVKVLILQQTNLLVVDAF